MTDAMAPLAERLRPKRLADFLGQDHLVGPGKLVCSLIEKKRIQSLIFWGPPGTGKTTLSRIIVRELEYPAMEFSATIAKIGEIREMMERAAAIKARENKPLVVFVDEIHHFNKHAQDAFLPYVERGDIVLLGTTIENPAYKINRALLSRMKILEFKPLADEVLQQLFDRALKLVNEGASRPVELLPPARQMLLDFSGGDARQLLNLLEILGNTGGTEKPIDDQTLQELLQKRGGGYDRAGEDRYQLISAFHKSVRNSDLDASLFWLYRMLNGGEDPLFIIRRMIRITVEDIGLADPEAMRLALHTKEAYEYLGSPEGDLFLAQMAVYLACAPKSNSLYLTEKKMQKIVEQYAMAPVPLDIVNPSNQVSAAKGAGKNYLYAHDFPEKTTAMNTLPPEIGERDFYQPNDAGFEKKIKERILYWQKLKEKLSGRSE